MLEKNKKQIFRFNLTDRRFQSVHKFQTTDMLSCPSSWYRLSKTFTTLWLCFTTCRPVFIQSADCD